MSPDAGVTSKVWRNGELLHKVWGRLPARWGPDIIGRNGFYEERRFPRPGHVEAIHLQAAAHGDRGRPPGRQAGGLHDVLGHHAILGFFDSLEIDCIAALDIAIDQADLHEIARKLPRKSFSTGPSNTFHLYETPAVVRKAVRDVFDASGRTGPLIAAASSVHPMMPWENTLPMVDKWRKLR